MDQHHYHYVVMQINLRFFWVPAHWFSEMELFVGEVEEQALDLGR